MVDLSLTHPLGDIEKINGKYQSDSINIDILDIPAFITLFAKKGKEAELKNVLGFNTSAGIAQQLQDFTAIPLSPEQWALRSHNQLGAQFGETIAKKIKGIGYVSEQSAGRVLFRIKGEKARDLMSRGCRLDLHPSAISDNYCSQTIIAQIGVLLHISDSSPVYDLYVFSGFARSFWHWLDQSAAQFCVSNTQ